MLEMVYMVGESSTEFTSQSLVKGKTTTREGASNATEISVCIYTPRQAKLTTPESPEIKQAVKDPRLLHPHRTCASSPGAPSPTGVSPKRA